jgi:mRNA-degrading endonuclease toxin of MazEF toxin-antitoxin module
MHVLPGEIWWISFGENIGSEINGKGRLFSRPGIIFKVFRDGFYFVIPTTTQKHSGNWYVPIWNGTDRVYACLHQARPVDYRRLKERMRRMSVEDFHLVTAGFKNLFN